MNPLRKRATAYAERVLPPAWYRRLETLARGTRGPKRLHMYLDRLDRLPPAEYGSLRVTAVTTGTEHDYIDVMRLSSLEPDADWNWYRHRFMRDPEYDPRNLIVLRDGEAPVAAAAAWQGWWRSSTIGELFYVGVIPAYQGRGLGRAVSLLALERLAQRGFRDAFLKTDDPRIPAITLYRSLGFQPVIFNHAHRDRWKRVLETADRSHAHKHPPA